MNSARSRESGRKHFHEVVVAGSAEAQDLPLPLHDRPSNLAVAAVLECSLLLRCSARESQQTHCVTVRFLLLIIFPTLRVSYRPTCTCTCTYSLFTFSASALLTYFKLPGRIVAYVRHLHDLLLLVLSSQVRCYSDFFYFPFSRRFQRPSLLRQVQATNFSLFSFFFAHFFVN